jgi:uncharacterized protein (UPF0332 family)
MIQFNPIHFLELSKALLDNVALPYENAKIRTIMSRCYYAIHLLARKKLRLSEGASHQKVYERIKNLNRVIGKELDYLWIYRIGADYRLVTPCEVGGFAFKKIVECNLDEANECIKRAERAVQEMEKLAL